MKIEIELKFPPVSLNIPAGAVRVTQWIRHNDHPKVLQDYVSGPCGDVDIDKWFIVDTRKPDTFISVKRGDWIFDMQDGSVVVVHLPYDDPYVMVQKALERAAKQMSYST